MEITLVQGDITTQHVDAIVNAANRAMRGGGGVDGAIHRAGARLCSTTASPGFRTGSRLAAPAGRPQETCLHSWVIHVVGPNYSAGERDRGLLTSCYAGALAVADELGAVSIAFPLVSAGIYGWPLDDAAAAAVETLRHTDTNVAEARLVAFGQAAYDALTGALGGDWQRD